MEGYSAEIEEKMQRFFGWLSEKDRRRYAALRIWSRITSRHACAVVSLRHNRLWRKE